MNTRISILLLALLISEGTFSQVSFDDILEASNHDNWLSYSRSLDNQRHSPLTQVNATNVDELELQWVWQARSL